MGIFRVFLERPSYVAVSSAIISIEAQLEIWRTFLVKVNTRREELSAGVVMFIKYIIVLINIMTTNSATCTN